MQPLTRLLIPSAAVLFLSACIAALPLEAPPTIVLEIPTVKASQPLPTTLPASATSLPTSIATARPTETHIPAPTATLLPTATPACHEVTGTVTEIDVPSPIADYPMRTRIYLPPCYEARPDLAYPVLYLLHGRGHTQATWDEIGVNEAADRLIASGAAPPFLIVMPREVGDDRFGDAVVADLITTIEVNFRAIESRDSRALGGMSRGGGWTLRIGLQNPQIFGALGFHSLAIFFVDEVRVNGWIDDVSESELPRIYIDIGEVDGLIVSAEYMHELLEGKGIAHTFIVQPGGHSTAYWSAHVEEYLRWYTAAWGSASFNLQDVEQFEAGCEDDTCRGLLPRR